jgi:hypothetical protein
LGGEIDSVPTGKPAVLLPHRSADGIDDHGVRHGIIVPDQSQLPKV